MAFLAAGDLVLQNKSATARRKLITHSASICMSNFATGFCFGLSGLVKIAAAMSDILGGWKDEKSDISGCLACSCGRYGYGGGQQKDDY